MIKLLPVVVFVILLIGTIFYLRSRVVEPIKTSADYQAVTVQSVPDNISPSEKIKILEQSIQLLAIEIGKINTKLSSSSSSDANSASALLETRVKNLETSVNSLKADVTSLKSPTSQTTSTSSKKSPEYIPLGSGGTSTDKNYYGMGGYQVSLDPADYPGYSSMQLEATLNLNELVGTINARLYNSTDNSAVSGSNASTSSTTATLVSSSGFTIASGKKTYVLQVQSTEGYQANIQSARIRVNF